MSLTFCTQGGRKEQRYQPRDPSNAISAAKGLFDGLVDAGWLVDDSQRWMYLGDVTIDSTRGPFVEYRNTVSPPVLRLKPSAVSGTLMNPSGAMMVLVGKTYFARAGSSVRVEPLTSAGVLA